MPPKEGTIEDEEAGYRGVGGIKCWMAREHIIVKRLKLIVVVGVTVAIVAVLCVFVCVSVFLCVCVCMCLRALQRDVWRRRKAEGALRSLACLS